MSGFDIRNSAARLGFGDFVSVELRLSVADLFPKSNRCGLYAIHFGNGEGYIGRTVNMVQRFTSHRTNHDDIVALAFRPLAASQQDREERAAISACEVDGVHLRNLQFASIVIGETDVDQILSPEAQTTWLSNNRSALSSSRLIEDADLRRKYKKRFELLCQSLHWPAVRNVLQDYVQHCVPAPKRTEMSFWAISCFPSTECAARINIHWQEVLAVFLGKNSIVFTFQLRRSILESSRHQWPMEFLRIEHCYEPGGADRDSDRSARAATGRYFETRTRPYIQSGG